MSSLPDEKQWASDCRNDSEFVLAARHWTGGLKLVIGERVLALTVEHGSVTAGAAHGSAGTLTFEATPDVWRSLLDTTPPPGFNNLAPLLDRGLVKRHGDSVVHAQYFGAVMRAIELLRKPRADEIGAPVRGDSQSFDTPVGRYVHLALGGHEHRIYFEQAGEGIPLLMQHTAGSHASQWRHLFECPVITRNFRLIAYDLPFHGKSLPPTTRRWWCERYQLTGEFLRSVPLALTDVLALDRPVFMGCSVGGLLALDLAIRHPDVFRAVISVEGALNVTEDDPDTLEEFWHPQVSDEYKGRAMDGLMSPLSPAPYRKETSFLYASGWPPAFLGDLHYYQREFDLRETASRIDTRRVSVHIMSGEYDWSGSPERGLAAHRAIAGSTWVEMKGVGHFPMSENPQLFIEYLLPVLEKIRDDRTVT